MPEYKYHRFAEKFPMMTDQEYRELVADIKANGLHEAITLYRASDCTDERQLLDGRNRERACLELGIKPIYVDYDEGDDDDALAYVISKNIMRRHLTTSQRAMVAADLATLKHGQRKGRSDTSNDVSQADAAKMTKTSLPTVQRAAKVKAKSPELAAKVRAGDVTVSGALAQLAAEQVRVSAAVTNGQDAGPAKGHISLGAEFASEIERIKKTDGEHAAMLATAARLNALWVGCDPDQEERRPWREGKTPEQITKLEALRNDDRWIETVDDALETLRSIETADAWLVANNGWALRAISAHLEMLVADLDRHIVPKGSVKAKTKPPAKSAQKSKPKAGRKA